MSKKGFISHIQHFSLGDGPGIRTTVFLQGCNLHCLWCHNPETIPHQSVNLWYESKCTACGLCAKVCPEKAISFTEGVRKFERALCRNCGTCETICPTDAVVISGKVQDSESVFEEIIKDADFYGVSDGGLTLSGGEPLLQIDFCVELARKCKESGIHVLVDTAGGVPFENFEKIIPYVDLFYFDLKASQKEEFARACGNGFELITDNLKRLAQKTTVIARMPVIPGYHNDMNYMQRCVSILHETQVKHVNLIPFHRLGSGKYQAMELSYSFADTKPLTEEKMKEYAEIFIQNGFCCRIEK